MFFMNSNVVKLIYRFNGIPIINQGRVLMGIEKQILKFIWKCKEPRIAKNKVRVLILPDITHLLIYMVKHDHKLVYHS